MCWTSAVLHAMRAGLPCTCAWRWLPGTRALTLARCTVVQVALFDVVNEVQGAWDNVQKVVEECRIFAESPDFSLLPRPEPVPGPDGEMVPPPTKQMVALDALRDKLAELDELAVSPAAAAATAGCCCCWLLLLLPTWQSPFVERVSHACRLSRRSAVHPPAAITRQTRQTRAPASS